MGIQKPQGFQNTGNPALLLVRDCNVFSRLAFIPVLLIASATLCAQTFQQAASTQAPPSDDHVCARCHPLETAGFEASPMARSLTSPGQQPEGTFVHAVSNTRFTVSFDHGRMLQSVERSGVSGTYRPAFAIGSGSHAVSYVIDINGHTFQSLICYYPGRGWAMAPGYEGAPAPSLTSRSSLILSLSNLTMSLRPSTAKKATKPCSAILTNGASKPSRSV